MATKSTSKSKPAAKKAAPKKTAAAKPDAKAPRVRLTGRFPVGTEVTLVKVHPAAPSAQTGTVVDSQKVAKDSTVTFVKDVEAGQPYFAVAEVDGARREVKVTGKVPGEPGPAPHPLAGRR